MKDQFDFPEEKIQAIKNQIEKLLSKDKDETPVSKQAEEAVPEEEAIMQRRMALRAKSNTFSSFNKMRNAEGGSIMEPIQEEINTSNANKKNWFENQNTEA